jgi:regulator of RNase E activity RraA
MKLKSSAILLLLCGMFLTTTVKAQTISKDEMLYLTSEWKGERFPDGRPRIPDDLLERAKHVMMDDVWNALRNEGYNNQFEGHWKSVNETAMTGRAVTAMYMPSRPDVEKLIKDRGAKQGRKGNTNSWPIDILTKGDLYVADAYGKIAGGPLMGSTLANSIFSKSGNGVVFDGASRDFQEIALIPGFNALVRDFHPSFTDEMVLMGLNTPIHIGGAIVLPGDLVIVQHEGVLFIPAHLAEKVISIGEFVVRKDKFGYEMVRTGKYSTGEIDNQWTDVIKTDFLNWLQKHPELGKMTRAELDVMMSKRTW